MYRLLRGKTKLGGDALLNVYKTLIKKQRDFEKKTKPILRCAERLKDATSQSSASLSVDV